MSRGRRKRRPVQLPADGETVSPPTSIAISDGEKVEQVPISPEGTVYVSVLTGYCHQFATELLSTMNRVEIMRDNLAAGPAPQELLDRLGNWIEALAVCHRHSGSVLAVFSEMQRKELGL